MQTEKTVLLACDDHDFGEVPADKAKVEAEALAKEEGKVIYLRDPVTDKVLGSIKPPAKKTAAKAAPNAPKATVARKAPREGRWGGQC